MTSTHQVISRQPATAPTIEVSTFNFGAEWIAHTSTLRNERSDTRNPKPNEDRFALDPVRQTVIVADGITRTKGADGSYPNPSPSAQAAELFCATVQKHAAAVHSMNLEKLQGIVSLANEEVAQFNRRRFPDYDFAERDRAGLAMVVGVIDGDSLWLASIADSFCIGVEHDRISRFAWEKTSHSRPEYVRLGEIAARKVLRNKPGNPLSYGALTGEPEALSFVEYRHISLASTERLIFSTDGLLRIAQDNPGALASMSADEVIRYGRILDKAYGETDDKTVVILERRQRHH